MSAVSASCDQGAHERCPGCACGCHAPGAVTLVYSHDRRLLMQALSAAIPGVTVLALLVWCITLAAEGLL